MLISWFEFLASQLCNIVIVEFIRPYLPFRQELFCSLDVHNFYSICSARFINIDSKPSCWLIITLGKSAGFITKHFHLKKCAIDFRTKRLNITTSCSVHPSASSSSGGALLSLKRNNPRADDAGMSFTEAQCLITGLPPADSLSLGSNGRRGKNGSLAWISPYKQWFNCWEASRMSGATYETDKIGDIKIKVYFYTLKKIKAGLFFHSMLYCVCFEVFQVSALRWLGMKRKTDFELI